MNNQEMAILLATRESENAQSLAELSLAVEAPIAVVGETVDVLVAKKILQESDGFDGIRYIYAENDDAQKVYRQIHQIDE